MNQLIELQTEIEKHKSAIAELEVQVAEFRGNQIIPCASCNHENVIKLTTCVQKNHYVKPYSCNGGDYWVEDEIDFLCNECGVLNRILFEITQTPYDLRNKYEWDPQEQFKRNYKRRFCEVIDFYRDSDATWTHWINNDWVDTHRDLFQLTEKWYLIRGIKEITHEMAEWLDDHKHERNYESIHIHGESNAVEFRLKFV